MGGLDDDVMLVLLIGIIIEVVGSILSLLLWKLIVNIGKWFRPNPQPPFPLVTAPAGESVHQPLTLVEIETLNAGEVVASVAPPPIPSPGNDADVRPQPTCLRT